MDTYNHMMKLTEMINDPRRVTFLESNGVFVSKEAFRARLRPPVNSALAGTLSLADDELIICSGQQLYIDYRQSVLSKVAAVRDLEQDPNTSAIFLWIDTDRSGSDSLITKFAWPTNSKKGPIGIVPSRTQDVELRFVELDATQLNRAIDKLGTHLRQSGVHRKDARLKYEELRKRFVSEDIGTLSAFNHRITTLLFSDQYGYAPYSVFASEIIRQDFVIREINLLLNNIDDVVRIFNESVESLAATGIDPQVKPREADYLPLFYSCEQDNQRFRLHHVMEGDDHFAIGACRARHVHKFYLGRENLSMDSIAKTGRWSPDIFLPALFNDMVSGFVAGKSSALYLIVLNAVLRRVLGKSPVPVLVPESLAKQNGAAEHVDSLVYSYFNAG